MLTDESVTYGWATATADEVRVEGPVLFDRDLTGWWHATCTTCDNQVSSPESGQIEEWVLEHQHG